MPQPTPSIVDSLDVPALLQKETRSLASAYEREAYLVYNLALTISCDSAAARRAAERGFLDAAARDVEDPAVVPATIAAALAEAPRRPELPAGGDEHTALMLAAMSGLDPIERATLAVQTLCGADATAIGPLMGLDPQAGAAVLERARAALARGLEIDPAELDAQLDRVLWTAPPDGIWESVFQAHYRAAEERLRRGAAAGDDAEPSPARRRRTGLFAGAGRWVAGTVAVAAIGVAATQLAAGAGAGGASGRSGADDGTAVAAAPGILPPTAPPRTGTAAPPVAAPDQAAADPAAKPHKPLTANQLDELRMAELADLKRYAKRQADQRLSPQQRLQAAQEVERIRNLAERRLAAAARREDRLRRELALARMRARARARIRAAEKPKPDAQAPAPKTKARPPAKRTPPPQQATPPPQPTQTTTTDSQEAGCLYNESDGTYVCPEGGS